MIVLVKANVLVVGLNGRTEALKQLPIRVITMRSGLEAARSLKTEKIDSIISNWDLPDMEDGKFLRALRTVKPNLPMIALVKPGDRKQEIAARSMGATAVLNFDTSDEIFRQTVTEILGLGDVAAIREISATADEREER